jgi:glyoxylase-like metal-dependent hydrolase (beta-lactamase superfamily II)
MPFHTLDLNFLDTPQVIAAYVLTGPTRAALIEAGPGSTLPHLLSGLRALGIQPGDVRDVLVTHIHLDHAGAAGWWAQQGATVHVHPFGAAHLIDPSRLLASARRIYGDMMDHLWGEFLASPADRVHVVNDGDIIEAADTAIEVIETPGHARHHHTYRIGADDRGGGVAFTGDSAGVRLPGHDWLGLPTPPPEFDLDAWQATVDRLKALNLARIYPTHFGEVSDPAEHFGRFAPLLSEAAENVKAWMDEGLDREQILERYTGWYYGRPGAAALTPELSERYGKANSLPMCVDGLMRYWAKRNQSVS